ncbi:raffinose/stachyose/melibiose transport system substrate-binding protein [Devosia enhydra]|uniref:Raffinose/stachyose/melibiose transport system substrate-binding protein n=1 Tax=Devosia enhydra TaxID=665118 RepID=A0A1K2HZL7_9HYPH|nr:ABC transporter substrate-binding protein [Devosia enhydra]SFZ84638.1 raffinose/stachyose/melibiose transport system substrate-binding protein [Devosia enhydra]
MKHQTRLGRIASICLAGCALSVLTAGAALAQTQVRLLAPASGSGVGFAAIAEKFNAAQSDVKVEIQRVPSGESYAQAMFTQLQAGAGADLIFTNAGYGAPESMLPLAEAGQLADLTDRAFAAEFPPERVAEYWSDGKLYGLPLSLTNVGLVYNVDLLAQNGLTPPETFEELLALCDKAVSLNKSAVGIAGSSPFYFYEAVAVGTVFVEDPDWSEKRTAGETTFAGTPGWTAAFERVKTMLDRQCFPVGVQAITPPQLFADIAAGNVLMAVGPTTLMGAVVNMNPAITLKMRPFPNDAAERTAAMSVYNDALSVNAKSANQDAAFAFLDYLSQPEQMAEFVKLAGGTAPADAAAGAFPPALEDMVPFYAEGRVHTVPHHAWREPAVRGVLISSGGAFLAGSKTAAEFVADLDAAWK